MRRRSDPKQRRSAFGGEATMENLYMLPSSLHPPSHGDGDGDADVADVPWILLDFRAYFADRRNSTTASCSTRDGDKIQVTFFPAQPPRVSYLCVYCPTLKARDFAFEPRVIATDSKFVLLRLAICTPEELYCPTIYEYYIYEASGGTDGGPSLELLPPNPYFLYHNQVGLLGRGKEFTVAALRDDLSASHRGASSPGLYDMCLFKSEENVWTLNVVFIPSDEKQCSNGDALFEHETSKVLIIGGEAGTLAFVDMWRGIFLVDVLSCNPILRYVKLLTELMTRRWGYESPDYTRDIVVVNGHFRFVEFLSKQPKVIGSDRHYINDGWIAWIWSKEVSSSQEDSWSQVSSLESKNIKINRNFWLPDDLEILHTGHPTLGLHADGILYLMTKVKLKDKKAWVIAIDMIEGRLLEVVEICADRILTIMLTYTQSKISEHLLMAPAKQRRGAGGEERVREI